MYIGWEVLQTSKEFIWHVLAPNTDTVDVSCGHVISHQLHTSIKTTNSSPARLGKFTVTLIAKMTFLLTVVDSRLQMFGESFILPSKKAPNKVVVRISVPLVTSWVKASGSILES